MGIRTGLATLAAGLALADASIVTLALPDLLHALDTSVEGVAAVLFVYAAVLAGAVLGAERVQARVGAARAGTAGALVFAGASLVCGLAGSLVVLLVARAAQAAGGAAVLVAAFTVLDGGGRGRRWWLAAAVLAAAAGPALGGALTELFSWRAIFLAQAPLIALAALAFRRVPQDAATAPAGGSRIPVAPAIALGLLSAALTAVLFLLVLLLVAGWGVEPLRAAVCVSVLPAAALAGARIRGDAGTRAAAGCALVGGGVLALAFLPDATLAWTVAPQIAAGLGMGLALPALAGELIPERTSGEARRTLALRHAGIALALIALAPIASADLDGATQRARESGVALVLDARLDPVEKLALAPALLGAVDAARPRTVLRAAIDERRGEIEAADRPAFERMAARADATLVSAVGEAFRTVFILTGVLALLAALAVLPRARGLAAAVGTAALALSLAGGYAVIHDGRAPDAVVLRDPCVARPLPGGSGLGGLVQDRALRSLDASACRFGSSREELVLALADAGDAERFEQRHGTNPRSLGGLLGLFLGG